jgi:hypothetical protein
LAALGSTFLAAGKVPVGVPFLGAADAFIAVGLASAHQAAPPEEGTGTQRPAAGEGGSAAGKGGTGKGTGTFIYL